MRKFEKIPIWTPDGEKNLDTIKLRIVDDNLKDSMKLYYEIGYLENKSFDTKEEQSIENMIFTKIYSGNIVIFDTEEKPEYTNLDTNNDIDINEEIFRVVAEKLKLTLIK